MSPDDCYESEYKKTYNLLGKAAKHTNLSMLAVRVMMKENKDKAHKKKTRGYRKKQSFVFSKLLKTHCEKVYQT